MTDHLTILLAAHNESLVDTVWRILDGNHALGSSLQAGLSADLMERLRRLRRELHGGADYGPDGFSCHCFRCQMRSYPATAALARVERRSINARGAAP